MESNSAVNLLVIEDNPADADLIKEYLSEVTEFEPNLVCVSTLKEGQEFLGQNNVHAVLVDLSLPDSKGLDTLKGVIGCLKTATAIVLTSLDDKSMALDAIASGAQDYLLKGALGPETLSRVIRYSLQRSKWQYKITEIQEQLYQSQKLESIGRLAGGIAHDFNNQLAVVNLLCSSIQEEVPDNQSVQKYVDQILNASNKSAELIKRLLTFSRRQLVELRVVDLNQILLESEKLLRQLLDAKIEIVVKCSGKMFVRIDPTLLEHMLMNLAINARDAMMPRGGKLTFESEVIQSKDGNFVLLKISDTGIGISQENLSKIFEPFFTTKSIGEGTGLGLSMVYGAIKQSGGDIHVESIVNQGTTFFISLPHIANGAAEKVQDKQKVQTIDGTETILLVEDEDNLRELTYEILQMHGYVVLTARDGLEALEIIDKAKNAVDLILTDVNMPKMGGVELRKEVLKVLPDIRFIFTSGYSMDMEELIVGNNSKNLGYLSKPASRMQLLEKIREVLDRVEVAK